jgi:putative acetyltransferase
VYPNLMQVPYTNEDVWRGRLAERAAPGRNDLMLVAERIVHGQAEVVGSAGLHPRSDLPRLRHVAMIGISVAAEAQRQGVGKALMQALCDYADRWMQVLRIELSVYSDNAAAIALYRTFGFEIEATQRGYALRDGAYVDSLIMARLHPNPPALPLPNASAPHATPPSATVQRGAASGSWSVRGCEEADLDAVAALMTRRGVIEDLPQTPWTPAERVREQTGKPAISLVALTQGHVVGYASLAVQPALRRRHAAGLAIFVAPEWQGRAVGSALLAALIEWADGWAGLLRIEVDVPAQSAAAAKLLAKFGFENEGTQRAALLRDGAFVDTHSMARLHPHPPRAGAPMPA